jgi:hypothetical protein
MIMQIEDNDNFQFQVIGIVIQLQILDISKTLKVQKFYTYITIKIEETLPAEIAVNLPVNELRFSGKTDEIRDRQISVGDQVTVTVVGNSYTGSTWFQLYDLKKVNS